MHIRLRWIDHNEGVTTRIYRSDTPFPVTGPTTEPLATLEPGALDPDDPYYDDHDVVEGETYHYLVEFVRDTLIVHSVSYTQQAGYSRGPGNQTLLAGTSKFGYFGEVNNFILRSELAEHLDEVSTAPVGARLSAQKILYQGRVVIVVQTGIANILTAPVVSVQRFPMRVALVDKVVKVDGFKYRMTGVPREATQDLLWLDKLRARKDDDYYPHPLGCVARGNAANNTYSGLIASPYTLEVYGADGLVTSTSNFQNPGANAASIVTILFWLED